jgi:hypothetical protein
MNNRQNGRRRGRGGQQARNGQPGAPDRGSRVDNRARGNAAQLLEKYKTLARDAQMQGDRVNTEYYLQFADHYFRVLSESRSRFEEQQQRRPNGDYRDDFSGDDDGGDQPRGYQQGNDANDDSWDDNEGEPERVEQPRFEQQQPQRNFRPRREDRPAREERPVREERAPYAEANGEAQPQQPQREYAPREQQPPRERAEAPPRRARKTNANGNGNTDNGFTAAPDFLTQDAGRIEIALPPSISGGDTPSAEADGAAEAEAPRRPRRPRRPRTEAAPVEA